nr:diguanylate cyclase [Methylorubrum extorquens]
MHNRRYLDRHLGPVFGEAALQEKGLACLLLDIDRFKLINDTYGHEAGDEVLRAFAERIRQYVRPMDILARYGGEEIVMVVPGAELPDARAIAERIRHRIEATPFAIDGGTRDIGVTVSVGVSVRRATDTGPSDLLKRADTALYRAKSFGRNRVEAAAA